MNISLSKNDLISALQIVSKGLSTKPQTPILSGIYMTAKEGQLELQSTNYELGFIVTIPAEIHTVGTAVLPGKYLTEFTRKLPADPAYHGSRRFSHPTAYGRNPAFYH